jgi:hypothetical protein
MKHGLCAGALLLALAGTAEAKSVAWCQVNGARYATYLSGIVEIDDGPDAFRAMRSSFGNGFKDYVQASLDPQASSPDCTRQDSLFYAEDYIDVLIKANPGYKFVKTGWRGSTRPTVSASQPRRGGGQSRADSLHYRR